MVTTLDSPATYTAGEQVGVADPDHPGVLLVGTIRHAAAVFGEWQYVVAVGDDEYSYSEEEIAAHQGTLAQSEGAPDAPYAPTHTPDPRVALVAMPLSWIEPDPDNERGNSLGDLTDLTASIRERGVLEPVRVFKAGERRFRLLSGHRRLMAATDAGLEKIPAIIVPVPPNDAEAALDRLVANLHRRDLSPLEEAHGFAALRAAGLTQGDIAAQVGKSQPYISRALGLLKQPEPVQVALAAGTLTPGHVEQLQRLADPALSWTPGSETPVETLRAEFAARAIDRGWGVRDLTTAVETHLSSQKAVRDHRASEAARQQREDAAADRAAREPARTATLAAEAAQREAQRKADEALRQTRIEVAQAAIRAVVGWPTGHGRATVAQLYLAARWMVSQATADPKKREEWHRWIEEAAQTGDSLESVIARIAVGQLTPDYEGRTLATYHAPAKWAERTWQLNARITAALEAAGLGETPPTAAPAATEDEDEDDNEVLDPARYCTICTPDGDGYEYEADEAGVLVCPNCGELAPTDDDEEAALAADNPYRYDEDAEETDGDDSTPE